MKKGIVSIVAVFVFLTMAVAAFATVTPVINIQGTHGSYIWRSDYSPPAISIGMQTDEIVLADWWLLCLAPTGWKYFSVAYGYWFDGSYPSYQGRLSSFNQTTIPTAGLDFTQPGSYLFFFGIDKTMDGQITTESLVYDIQSVNVFPAGKAAKTVLITIFDSFQVAVFDKLTNSIFGFSVGSDASPIDPTRVKKVKEVSDRVGWASDSVAVVAYDSNMVTMIIPNTANNDRCEWVLELSNGDFAWANPDWVAFAGKTVTWNATAGLFEYGGYHKQTVYFSNGQAYLDFACNLTDGFVAHINPSDISYVKWNQDGTNWDELLAWGTLQVDVNSGNYYVWMNSGAVSGSGLFSIIMRDGSTAWINKDKWIYSGATLVGERIVVN